MYFCHLNFCFYTEPTVDSEMLGPSALKESCPDSNQKGQEEHSAVVPRDNSFQQPAVQSSNGRPVNIICWLRFTFTVISVCHLSLYMF